jgi:DNA-binding LacI/PurR family transcriptional regulator
MRDYGYRRIGFVVGEIDAELDGSAYAGFCAAQNYLKLKPILPPLFTSRAIFAKDPDRVGQELKDWLEREKPDAILTTEPQIPDLIRKLGWRIPKDVAVAGTDTNDLPIDSGPDENPDVVGRIGIETLVKQLQLNEMGEPSHPVRILVESRWHDGKSLPPIVRSDETRTKRQISRPSPPQVASPVPLVKKRVTVRDIAGKMGCSFGIVAMALRGHPSVSTRRRDEILRMAEQMGYRKDPSFSALVAYRKKDSTPEFKSTIAWVNHWEQPEALLKHGEFNAYWQGAKAAAAPLGYQLADLRWATGCPARQFEKTLLDRGVRGILIPPHFTAPDWEDFDWSKFSIIRFGLSISVPDSDVVTADQYRAVVMAITRMNEYGYRRIGLVLNEAFDRRIGGNYYAAFCWAQQKLGLTSRLPPLMTDWETGGLKKGRKALAQWLKQHQPDAILTADPEVPEALRELDVRIPQDIAAAGTSVYDITLDAGIDQCSEAIGRIAVESLVKQINLGERGVPADPCRILVESRWQDGKSLPRRTKPAR